MNSPSKHLLLPRPTYGWLPDIWALFHAETLMLQNILLRKACDKYGCWEQVLLKETNQAILSKTQPLICIQRSGLQQQLLFLSKIHLLGSKGRNDIPTTRPGVKDVPRAQTRTRIYSRGKISIIIKLQRTQLHLFLSP